MIYVILSGLVIFPYRRRMPRDKKEALLISDILRKFRNEKNLSQAELAGRLGIEQSYISLLEVGKRTPSIIMLIKIADAMEVSPGEMVDAVAVEYRRLLDIRAS